MLSKENRYKKEVRSYVIRSRMTLRQRMGYEQFWPAFGLEITDQELNFTHLFQRDAPTILEIGFGMGGSLIHFAKTNPHINFLGIEVHRPGVGAILSAISENKLTNVRVFCTDATKVIQKVIPDNSLFGALLFFPDPWPKRRHHKRRIVQPDFVNLVYEKLTPRGYFHVATDVKEYAVHMLQVMNSHPALTIINERISISDTLIRPKTKFERRGERLGHIITDLVFLKNA